MIVHVVSGGEEEICIEESPLVKIIKKVLMEQVSRPARRCCLLSANQLILQLPLHISRLSLCLKKGKNGGKKDHLASQCKAGLLFHRTCMSCYENEEKIKQPRPDEALDFSCAIIVTGSLYSYKEYFFLKFNNCFHDTDVY